MDENKMSKESMEAMPKKEDGEMAPPSKSELRRKTILSVLGILVVVALIFLFVYS